MEGSSYHLPNLLHSPLYDPFDPFQAYLAKFNPDNYSALQSSETFAEETPYGSQSRRALLDAAPKCSQQLGKKSCLIQDNNAKGKRNDSKKKKRIDKKSDIIKGQWSTNEDS